jgi:hypothetical protein
VISWVVFLVENIYLFDLPSIVGLWTTHCGPLMVMFMPLDALKLTLLATSLSQSCLTLKSWTSSSWSCSQLYEHIKHE